MAAALALSSTAVKAWQVENGAMPTAADFAAIPGATSNGGATVTYKATSTGFCLTGTSSGQPSVTRVWLEPGRPPGRRRHLLRSPPTGGGPGMLTPWTGGARSSRS